jgi:hypothetical protein
MASASFSSQLFQIATRYQNPQLNSIINQKIHFPDTFKMYFLLTNQAESVPMSLKRYSKSYLKKKLKEELKQKLIENIHKQLKEYQENTGLKTLRRHKNN